MKKKEIVNKADILVQLRELYHNVVWIGEQELTVMIKDVHMILQRWKGWN